MGERRGARRLLVGKPEGKRPLRRPRCKWGNNITIDLQELGIDFSNSGEGQRASSHERGNENWGPQYEGKFFTR
jgi:hypothetical protein